MEIKKNVLVLLVVVIVLISSLAIVFVVDDILLRNEISTTKKDLEENITKLNGAIDVLNASNLFFNTYLVGLGTYYNTTEIQETAYYKMEQAWMLYNNGYWSNALAWYSDGKDWCTAAWQKFKEAEELFENASISAINSTYQNIALIYSQIMNTSSTSMIYAYEACEYYAAACEFYLNKNYDAAHESYDKADLKMTYHDQEKAKIQEYMNTLNTILIEIS